MRYLRYVAKAIQLWCHNTIVNTWIVWDAKWESGTCRKCNIGNWAVYLLSVGMVNGLGMMAGKGGIGDGLMRCCRMRTIDIALDLICLTVVDDKWRGILENKYKDNCVGERREYCFEVEDRVLVYCEEEVKDTMLF
ncbi:hypothetical protein Tco_0300123 [Tanacetum coccineum]